MKNLMYVLSSKVIVLIIGVLAGFVIPWTLGVNDYGYYQKFMLYLGYIWLFNLGFNDGIYLKYGSYDLEQLPKMKFISYFKHLFLKQVFLMIIGICISLLIFKGEMKFIFVSLSINIVLVNFISYFFYLFQITRKFKAYSYIVVLQKTLIILPIIYSIAFYNDFRVFILANILINFIVCCICIFRYKSIIFGKNQKISSKEYKNIYYLGVPLLLGNFIGTLILSIDKMLINIFYTTEDLAFYSFAVNMLVVILVFLDSLYQVMYPKIKRMEKVKYDIVYKNLSNIVLWMTFFCLGLYYFFVIIINNALPDYVSSLEIFAILLIGIMLRSENVIVKKSFILSENKQKLNFLINIFVLLLAIILNIIAIIIFDNLVSIAVASVISFLVWYIILDVVFYKMNYTIRKSKYIYIIILVSVHLMLVFNGYTTNSLIIYYLVFIFILILDRKNIVKTYNFVLDIFSKK